MDILVQSFTAITDLFKVSLPNAFSLQFLPVTEKELSKPEYRSKNSPQSEELHRYRPVTTLFQLFLIRALDTNPHLLYSLFSLPLPHSDPVLLSFSSQSSSVSTILQDLSYRYPPPSVFHSPSLSSVDLIHYGFCNPQQSSFRTLHACLQPHTASLADALSAHIQTLVTRLPQSAAPTSSLPTNTPFICWSSLLSLHLLLSEFITNKGQRIINSQRHFETLLAASKSLFHSTPTPSNNAQLTKLDYEMEKDISTLLTPLVRYAQYLSNISYNSSSSKQQSTHLSSHTAPNTFIYRPSSSQTSSNMGSKPVPPRNLNGDFKRR